MTWKETVKHLLHAYVMIALFYLVHTFSSLHCSCLEQIDAVHALLCSFEMELYADVCRAPGKGVRTPLFITWGSVCFFPTSSSI